MKYLRKISYLSLIFILLLSTGCVFLRLLKVKNQLNDFDTNFDLHDQRGLTLVFKNPVLLSDDMVWLMKGEPSEMKKIETGELWTYIVEKEYPLTKNEEENYDIPLIMIMEYGKLSELSFPERFLKNLSIPLLKRMFASMGNADVSKLSKSANSEFKGTQSEIPTVDNVLEALGKPYSIESTGEESKYYYLYYIKKPEWDTSEKNFKFELEFRVDNEDKTLLGSRGTIRGLKLSMDFNQAQN